MSENTQKTSLPPIGARLKNLRLEKGISLEEAHKKTKIHLDILRAIEEENFVNINLIYLKGFIKIYCGFLGEDPGSYLAALKEGPREFVKPKILFEPKQADGTSAKRQLPQRPQSQPHPLRKAEGERPEPQAEPPRIQRPAAASRRQRQQAVETGIERRILVFKIAIGAVVILVAAALVFGIVGVTRFVASKMSSARRSAPAAAAVRRKPAPVPAAQSNQSPKKAVPAVKPAVAETQRKPAETKLTVGINALEDCWVQAKVDGKVVFQGIIKRGRFEAWEAQDKLELALGNAGAVRVEVNGAVQPPLGKRGEVIRGIVFSRGGGYKIGK